MRSGGIKNPSTVKVGDQGQVAAGKRRGKLPANPLSQKNLLSLTEGLAVGFPDRVFGTATGKKSAEWMAQQMAKIGLEPTSGDSFLQEFTWDIAGVKTPGFNVAGMLRGTDPKLADEYIIVAAHHDSQPDTRVGANDNATGCAGVLGIAQALAKAPPKRSVIFMTFDGEEGMTVDDKYQPGRRGSKHYADNPLVPHAKTAMLVNMDMIGQVHLEGGARSQIHQWASRDSFAQQVLGRASKATLQPGEQAVNGYPEQHDQAQMFSTDAEPLYRLGIPTVNFLSGRDLDNHAPEDDMSRIIPERIAQYGKLAHRVVVEGANHPESLSQMGITPGGLMPAYSMIRATKGAGTKVHEEEQLRLDDLVTRMPNFKAAAKDLVAQIGADPKLADKAGLDLAGLAKTHGGLVKEPVLNAVREKHAELAGNLHGIDKNDAAARKPVLAQLEAVQGIEDVLAGAIYVGKIEKTGNYYMQQVPARLADLNRGARRLGLEAKLDGVVFDKDVVAFAPTVSADRAVQVATDTLSGLAKEVGIATYALVSPERAASDERAVKSKDLDSFKSSLLAAAKEAVGGAAVDGGACIPMVFEASMTAQLAGLKGSPNKWVGGFVAKNAFTDFDGFIGAMNLNEADTARLREQAANMLVEGTPNAIVSFYRDLTQHVLGKGHEVDSLDALRDLAKPGAISAKIDAAKSDRAGQRASALLDAAAGNADIEGGQKLVTLVESSLALAALFDTDKGSLPNGTRLLDVKAQIDNVIDAADKTPGAQPIAEELRGYSQWLEPFIGLEGRAKEQARLRGRAAQSGLGAVNQAWQKQRANLAEAEPKLAGAMKGTASKTLAALSEQLDLKAIAEGPKTMTARTVHRVQMFKDMEAALSKLVSQPSPAAEATLRNNLEAFGLEAGPAAQKALAKTLEQLDELHRLDDVQMGRQGRGGPLSVVALRALDGKDNG